jgi:ABC-type branched-subunit amino acid transport system permease subunit
VALLTSRTDMNPWLALALAAVISGVCGVLIALPSLRVKGPYLAMVTLAFGIVVEKLVGEWTDVFGGAQGIYGIRPLDLERRAAGHHAVGLAGHRAVRGAWALAAPSRTWRCSTP